MIFQGQIIVHSTRLNKRKMMLASAFAKSIEIKENKIAKRLFFDFLLSQVQTVDLNSNLR